MKLQIAHLILEVIRVLMDLYNWVESKRPRPTPMSYEVYSVHCYDCNKPTGAFVSDNGVLLPPTFCKDCVSLDENEESSADEEEEEADEDESSQEVPEG